MKNNTEAFASSYVPAYSYQNIPVYLRENGLFCAWRYELHHGRTTKVPYNVLTGHRAQSNDPNTFCPFDKAIEAAGNYDGIGIGIFGSISAIDIDNCVDEDGELNAMALDIITLMDSYTELSPSGKGIRILFKTADFEYDKERYYVNNRNLGLEVYVAGATKKYVTLTGNIWGTAKDVEQRDFDLQVILDQYMGRAAEKEPADERPVFALVRNEDRCSDEKLIKKAKEAKNGALFAQLWAGDITGYPSHSEADMALCGLMAFWAGHDAARMDRLFRQSGLMRSKWDETRGGSTYGAGLIKRAIAGCREAYIEEWPSLDNADDDINEESEQSVELNEAALNLIREYLAGGNMRYGFDHIGSSNLFADAMKTKARYVRDRGVWFVYDGQVWHKDDDNIYTMCLCKQIAGALKDCNMALSEEKREANDRIVSKWQTRAFREIILKDAAGVHSLTLDQFDADPNILNVLNGELHLKTMQLSTHNPEHLLTRIAKVEYNPAAVCSRWIRFIEEVMVGDEDLARFFQKACGYALTGCTEQECFFILYGKDTRNGKGTAMETLLSMLGDYGLTINPGTLVQKNWNNGSSASPDIARLLGARLVNTSELEGDFKLNSALVKRLTGNDKIATRNLYEGFFEYRPEYKIFINTNRLPKLEDQTLFQSGRVKVIPFLRKFSESEQDKGLKAELRRPENLSGILNWCLAGWEMMQETGLKAPEAVQKATEDYKNEADALKPFFDEVLEIAPEAEVFAAAVFEKYKHWCVENGEAREKRAIFYAELRRMGMISKRPKGSQQGATNMLPGYRFKPDGLKNVEDVDF